MGVKIDIFDSTLRDGAQARGINYSLSDKMLELLDSLGVDYIEAGNPFNPKIGSLRKRSKCKHAKLVAFGSTAQKRRWKDAGVKADGRGHGRGGVRQSVGSARTGVIGTTLREQT